MSKSNQIEKKSTRCRKKKCENILPKEYEYMDCEKCRKELQDKHKAAFIDKSKLRYPDKFDYSLVEYYNMKTHVDIICKLHNNTFSTSPISHLDKTNKSGGCSICRNEAIKLKPKKQPKKRVYKNKYTNDPDRCCSCRNVYIGIGNSICENCKEKQRQSHLRRKIEKEGEQSQCEYINPKSGNQCKSNCPIKNKWCKRHEKLGTDLDNGIERCARNGCNEILIPGYEFKKCKYHLKMERDVRIAKKKMQRDKSVKESPNVQLDFIKWLAGFIDGDGSICMCNQNGGTSLQVSISQSYLPILKKIQTYYPLGKLYGPRLEKGCKPQYWLRFCGIKSEKLLLDIKAHIIIKQELCENAIEYLEYIKKSNETPRKQELITIISGLTKSHNENTKDYSRLCAQYISGLFDAEGNIQISKPKNNKSANTRLKLTQKNDIVLLDKLAKRYNNGSMSNFAWNIFNSKTYLRFINDIKPFSKVKLVQLDMLEIYCKETNKSPEFIQDIHNMIQNEKHTGKQDYTIKPVKSIFLLQRKTEFEKQLYSNKYDNDNSNKIKIV